MAGFLPELPPSIFFFTKQYENILTCHVHNLQLQIQINLEVDVMFIGIRQGESFSKKCTRLETGTTLRRIREALLPSLLTSIHLG